MSRTGNASTILHADFVGNSRLAATDDDRALPRRVGQGVDLLDPAMGPHDGRIARLALGRLAAQARVRLVCRILSNY